MESDELVVKRSVYDNLVEFNRDARWRVIEFDNHMSEAPKAVRKWWDELEDGEFKFKFGYLRERGI